MRKLASTIAALVVVLPSLASAEDMIQVDVQVLEINKTKLYRVGLDWTRTSGRSRAVRWTCFSG